MTDLNDRTPATVRPPTRAECAMTAAIDALVAHGFIPDGQTVEQIVRIPTRNSPVLGRSGGELARFGGRPRFCLAETDIKATVGRRTVAVYRVTGAGSAGVVGIATVDTVDLDKLARVLDALS